MRIFRKTERGSALILAMVVTIIGAGMAATALSISAYQSKTTSRESTRERALTVAESGLDAVIFRMNNWTTGSPLSTVTGTIGGDTYTVTVTPAFSGVAGNYTLRASGTRDHEKRGIQTVVSPTITSQFPYGLAAKGQITMSGDSVNDSYKSTMGTYMSQRTNYDSIRGEYYARTSGNIGTNGNISMSGSVVNYGNANPGTSGSISLSGGPYVSGTTTQASTPISFPNPPAYNPGMSSMGDFQPSSSTTLSAGTYRFNKITLSGSTALNFVGDVTIYVDGDVSISGQAYLNMLVGSKVKIIQNSGSFNLSGGGLVNTSQVPGNFSLTSSGTNVNFSGNTAFYGTMYAPNAVFSASGTTDYFGAFAASSMNISGGANFHYDEDLGGMAVPGSYRIRSWIEYIP